MNAELQGLPAFQQKRPRPGSARISSPAGEDDAAAGIACARRCSCSQPPRSRLPRMSGVLQPSAHREPAVLPPIRGEQFRVSVSKHASLSETNL